jgi:sirohydrochlorin cobaltochelatase
MAKLSMLLCLLSLVACASAERTAPPAAPRAAPGAGDFGVIVMAHGGTPQWNDAVLQTVAPLRAKYEIEVAFGMADAKTLQDAVRKLEARSVRRIGVVRLFVSGESWKERTEQIFGLRGGAPAASEAAHAGHGAQHAHGEQHAHGAPAAHGAPPPTTAGAPAPHGAHAAHGAHAMAFYRVETQSKFALSSEGLADVPGMAQVLADRVAALSKAAAREDVLILAHGPGDDEENARWIAKIDALTTGIRARAPFRRVQVETLREDWPDKRAAAEQRIRAYVTRASAEGGTAIVLPFRVQGFGPYAQVLQGLDYVSDGTGLIPHDEVGKWIERQIAELAVHPFDGGAHEHAGAGHAH